MSPAEPGRAVRAVIFDLGGVVLTSPFPVFDAHERERGLPPGTVTRVIVSTGPHGPWDRLERGELDYGEFCAALDAAARDAGHELDAHSLMTRASREIRIVPQMLEAVRGLRTRGLAVAALTNNWFAPDPLASAMAELSTHFDVFVESCREGVNKPDPRIYRITLERLGVEGHEAVFLDDIGRNLKPAAELGMATIKVEHPAQALADLDVLLRRCGRAACRGSRR